MAKETTAVLLERIEGKIDGINDHLARLNGSVAKHGEWMERHSCETTNRIGLSESRWGRQDTINMVIGAVSLAILGGTITLLIKVYGG